uniref:Saposin B-type domain-containing protein n=1 Tax=Plectus sambesii TaxID=2011161 RepID=A0A914WMA1_9BILA
MRLLFCVALVVIAVAFADAQDFSDKRRDFETGKSDFMGKREEINLNSEVLCGVCTELMLYAKAYAHQSQSELEHTLDGLCKSLFEKHETEELMCETIVKEEMPTIIKYIDTELSPDGICRILDLCA